MLQKSSAVTNPSSSRSAFANIFSSYSSDMSSPRSCATLFKSDTVTFPAFVTSKDANTLLISTLLSFSLSLAVASLRNSGKSIPPDSSSSSSARIWQTNLFCPPNPRLIKASFSSWGSMVPEPSPSKMSKACLMSLTSSRGMVMVTQSSGWKPFFQNPLDCALVGVVGVMLVRLIQIHFQRSNQYISLCLSTLRFLLLTLFFRLQNTLKTRFI